jgi:hypothetical protein
MIESITGPGAFEEKKKYSREKIEELLLGLFSAVTRDVDGNIPAIEPLPPVKSALDAKSSDYLYDYIMESLAKDPSFKDASDVLYAAKRLSSFI